MIMSFLEGNTIALYIVMVPFMSFFALTVYWASLKRVCDIEITKLGCTILCIIAFILFIITK